MSAQLMNEDKSHLTTGYLPSVEEANAIRTRNMKRGKLIRGIYKEITTLRARRRRLIVASTIGKAIIVPIRKIPVDVLEEILFQCIPPFNYKLARSHEYHLHPQDACKLLGNISKEWCTIINDSPRLWSSIFIRRGPRAVENVCQSLKKSKSHPLDIFIESNDWSLEKKIPVSTNVFAVLRRELWQIRTLIAHMDWEDELFQPGFTLQAPLMQSLTLSCLNPLDDLDLGGAYCTELRSVTLELCDSIVRSFTANHMQSVRHLQLNSLGPHALYLQFLNSLPTLSLYIGLAILAKSNHLKQL